MKHSVFLFIPNLIGYFRLVLIVVGWFYFDNTSVFLPLYGVSAFLDGIDGCAARSCGQTSAFGAWLDVLVDNIGRSVLWSRLYDWGIFVVCVEWTVFVCTHTMGSQWKQAFAAAPWWVKAVMENGFYTPAGVFVVAGVHVLPACLYFYQRMPHWFQHAEFLLIALLVILTLGRLLCLAVELWCIKTHILHLVRSEEDKAVRTLTKELDSSRSNTPS